MLSPTLAAEQGTLCAHCGSPSRDARFCCPGCEAVFTLLQSRGLSHYYELRDRSWQKPELRTSDSQVDFAHLDLSQVRAQYVQQLDSAGHVAMRFFIEGVSCIACVWLLEKLPQWVAGVESAKLNLAESTLTVVAQENSVSFAALAREIQNLGYRPVPVLESSTKDLRRMEDRTLLKRMAVAGMISANIMLLAIASYAGAGEDLLPLFSMLSGALFLPSLFYSAAPLFQTTVSALKQKRISIDLTLVVAIAGGALLSYFNLFRNRPEDVYFDSLSSLIFLILASRFLLRKAEQKAFTSAYTGAFLMPMSAHRIVPRVEDVSLDALSAGDIIEVRSGERLPVDGEIVAIDGTALLSSAVLSGESQAEPVKLGQLVFAGSVNEGDLIQLKVNAVGSRTRLANILQLVDSAHDRRAPVAELSEKVATWFTLAVLIVATTTFAFGLQAGFADAVSRTLALLLVSCPCAFALATPLAFAVGLGEAARRGLLIKGGDVIERLAKVQTAFLDKTGTITVGAPEVLSFELQSSKLEDSAVYSVVASLEARSQHPLGKALYRYCSQRSTLTSEVSSFHEIPGRGVSGRIDDHFYEVRRTDATRTGVFRDGELVASFTLRDQIRQDSIQAIEALKALKLDAQILSGDSNAITKEVASQVGINKALGELSPEEKLAVIESTPSSLMVGDGANDAAALAAASVSIAVRGSVETSLRVADIYCSRPGLRGIADAIGIARWSMRKIRLGLGFSIVYNSSASIAAICGLIDPLVAAILMPINSLIVIGIAARQSKVIKS